MSVVFPLQFHQILSKSHLCGTLANMCYKGCFGKGTLTPLVTPTNVVHSISSLIVNLFEWRLLHLVEHLGYCQTLHDEHNNFHTCCRAQVTNTAGLTIESF